MAEQEKKIEDENEQKDEILENGDVKSEKKVKKKKIKHSMGIDGESWDPFKVKFTPPNGFCIARLKKDMEAIFKDPIPLLFIAPDEDDIRKIHAIVCGPADTPYEGGFFYFFVMATSDYPILPPKVKLMTTGNGTVRMNPNLYKNGKVCLSILGTWPGPSWSAANTIQSVLVSIQSLLNDTPYSNEPGSDHKKNPTSSLKYNEYLRHETLRVAVCDMLERNVNMPPSLYAFVKTSFCMNLDFYEDLIEKNLERDGGEMFEPYLTVVPGSAKFDYASLKMRFASLKTKLSKRKRSEDLYDFS